MFQAEVRKNQIISQTRVDCYYIRCEGLNNNVLVMGKDEEWYDLNAIEEDEDKEIVSPDMLLMSKEQATKMMEDYNYKVRISYREQEKQDEVH